MFASLIYDVLWMIGYILCVSLFVGLEVDGKLGCSDEQKPKQYESVIRMVVSSHLCTIYELNCRLETDTMLQSGLITADFTKLMIRTYTKRHYAQSKFNLLRDENEGYAKLLSYLHQPVINPYNGGHRPAPADVSFRRSAGENYHGHLRRSGAGRHAHRQYEKGPRRGRDHARPGLFQGETAQRTLKSFRPKK